MLKTRLSQIALSLLNVLAAASSRAASAVWELALENPRMTAKGVASALVIAGAHWGLRLTPDQTTKLAVCIVTLLGVAGRDKKKGLAQ